MAANFTISDNESDEDLEEENKTPDSAPVPMKQRYSKGHTLTLPELRRPDSIRIRQNSESAVHRDEELQNRTEEEPGTPTEGFPFRGRSKSAPPALWAAKKYGQQLRRMSDEFDSLLDKGEMKKLRSAETARPIHHSKTWWSYLFSHAEIEGENNHHDSHRFE